MDRILFEKMTYAEGGLSGAFSSGFAWRLYLRFPVGCTFVGVPSLPSVFAEVLVLASFVVLSSGGGEAALFGARACLLSTPRYRAILLSSFYGFVS